MAEIGSLGDTIFSVSQNQVKTFDDMSWESSAKYSAHDRHLKDPILEFTGLGADTISFSMYFSVFLGVDPLGEIVKLLKAEREGKVMSLIIGPKKYGTGKWVITGTSKKLIKFDSTGRLLIASVDIKLTAYAGK